MNNKGMAYGYMDESGAPGVAISKKDYFLVAVAIFDSAGLAEEASVAIDGLRQQLNLPPAYEFHRSSNSPKIQKEFQKFIGTLSYRFITVAIKKGDSRSQATYDRLAKLLVEKLAEYRIDIKIYMDTSPILYKAIRGYAKQALPQKIYIKELRSKSSNLIQLADYLANISAKKIKGARITPDDERILCKQLK